VNCLWFRMQLLKGIKILFCTDIASRGLHIENISCVINFDLPRASDDYIHRIGRTGRAGTTGKSITFACEMESCELTAIEKLLGMERKCTMPPKELLEELPPAPPRKKRPPRQSGGGGSRRPQNGGRRSGPPRRK